MAGEAKLNKNALMLSIEILVNMILKISFMNSFCYMFLHIVSINKFVQ